MDMQETDHVDILQRNHKYLKEKLQVEPVLDALYQDCVFTQADYDRCRQAGPEKCEMLLEILKKKGQEGYRTLCSVLDTTQPFIKERLDGTSTESGQTSNIFVNKIKMEAWHRKEIEEKMKQIALLQSENNDLKLEMEQLRRNQVAVERTRQEEQEGYISRIEEQSQLLEELKSHLAQSQEDLQKSNEQCDELKKMLEEETEAYKSLVGLSASPIRDNSGHIGKKLDEAKSYYDLKQACVLSVHGHCDTGELLLLPCLHAACESCIGKLHTQGRHNKLRCPCGQDFTMEDAVPDYVRRNEADFASSSEKDKRCTYLQRNHDTLAVVYCTECDDHLCPNCLNIHNSIRQHSSHTVREISETKMKSIVSLLKESYCEEHPHNKLQLYDHHCKKPVCVVCLHGAHKLHSNSDLKHLHAETKNHLLEDLKKQECKLQNIRDTLKCANHHQNKLHETKNILETEIMTVHRSVAIKFLRRQAQLLQDIPLALRDQNESIQAQIDLASNVEASTVRTIDYIQRALKSTRHWELICLTEAINKNSKENLKVVETTVDERSIQVRFSFQGKKALEKLIDTSGCLATNIRQGDIPDTQPSIADLQTEIHTLAQYASEREMKLDGSLKALAVHQQRWVNLERIITQHIGVNLHEYAPAHITEANRGADSEWLLNTADVYEVIKTMLTEGVGRLGEQQTCIKLKVCPSNMDIVGQNTSPRLLVCPELRLDVARANKKCCHVNAHGELINSPLEAQGQTKGGFQMYFGTCTSTPIFIPPQLSAKPNVDTQSPQYWETQSDIGVVSEDLHLSIFEMGVSEQGQMDKWYRACNQFRSWSVRVWSCDRHQGRICTAVYQEGERGRCFTDAIPLSPKTQATLRFGVVLDVWRGRIGFIDLHREIVLAKCDVEIREPLYPMFGVVPKSSECVVKMNLVSGQGINMTAKKKSLIDEVLTPRAQMY
ncbi:polyamine-modulated factor 1-binding protein 1-like isoform X2 [Haliotis asinina]|uniref:polyamine-modulated factor 1-binding protein 1-like isoform X2 n=1 Tax=Haliotis asinina TaxID=109174 RepID=UPI0035325338